MRDKIQKKVIMAEFTDVRFDARVVKEAKAISKLGYLVHLHMFNTSEKYDKVNRDGNIIYHIYGFDNRYNDGSRINIFLKYLKAVTILARINLWILFHKADVYHAHNLKFILMSFIASVIFRSKFVYDAHELHSEKYDEYTLYLRTKEKINVLIEKFVLLRCHAFIQASEERAEFIKLKYRTRKPYVINNYMPLKKVDPSNNKLREVLNIENDWPIMFYSGGVYLGGGRRMDKVFHAMKDIDHLYFVIISFMNKSIKSELDNLLNELGLAGRVFILPPISNEHLFEFISSADFGVIPLDGKAINNQLSALNKVSEFMMAGLPFICTDYENLNRLIYDNGSGQIGETFDISSIESINKAIKSIIKDDRYKEYSVTALKLAHEKYNWEIEENKLQSIYRNFSS